MEKRQLLYNRPFAEKTTETKIIKKNAFEDIFSYFAFQNYYKIFMYPVFYLRRFKTNLIDLNRK